MAWGDAIFEVEQIEKLPLIAFLLTHHDPPPTLNESSSRESCRAENHEPFSTASTHFDICGSEFLQRKLTTEPHFAGRNFLFLWPELKAKFGIVPSVGER